MVLIQLKEFIDENPEENLAFEMYKIGLSTVLLSNVDMVLSKSNMNIAFELCSIVKIKYRNLLYNFGW